MSQETESSPHEAEIAARRVESLREKYGITEAELATSDFSEGVASSVKKSPPWRDWLALAVAIVNDCVVEKTTGYHTELSFKGFEQDVVLAQLQFAYIITQMDRHWLDYKATLERSSKAINSSFKRGYAVQMKNRLNELADDREGPKEAGTALVPMKMAMVKAEFGKQKTRSRKQRGVSDGGAFHAGKDAAKRTGINGAIA
jgi:hypothetical protein